MVLSTDDRTAKLNALAESWGMDVDALLEQAALDSLSPAICTLPACDYTTEMEPDQRAGYCEACGGNTVQSALVLAGLM